MLLDLLALCGALLQADPGLPAPGGPHAVGTTTLCLVDRTRPAPGGGEGGRALMLQLWYPAREGSGAGPAPYLPDPRLGEAMIEQGYFEQAPGWIRSWSTLATHARLDADLVEGEPLPVLLLSHGLGVSRMHYTCLALELASHGYAVAALDHPRGGLVVLEDGTRLSTEDDPELEEHWEERALEWVDDMRFALDELGRRFPGRLALGHVGVLGHSMGGAAALAAGGRDGRVAACADLDGAPLALTEREGLRCPALFVKSEPVYSDAELAAKGRTRSSSPRTGTWPEITARGTAPCLYVGFAGTGHMSFSDAPFVMPDTITRFGGRQVPFPRAQRLLVRLLLAFFDQHLRGESDAALRALDAEEELELFWLAPGREAAPGSAGER